MKTIEDLLSETIDDWMEYSRKFTNEITKMYLRGDVTFILDGILVIYRGDLERLIYKLFCEKAENILKYFETEGVFGGFVARSKPVEAEGKIFKDVADKIFPAISKYISRELGERETIFAIIYYGDIKREFFPILIAHEILEMGMTYYVFAVSLKLSGMLSNDLLSFRHFLSEWIVYNVLGYKIKYLKSQLKEILRKNKEKLELELYLRSKNFQLKKLEEMGKKNEKIQRLAGRLRRSAILLKLGEGNIFNEFLKKYSKLKLKDLFNEVNKNLFLLSLFSKCPY